MWVSLVYLVTFIIVLLRSGTGYPFSSFSTKSCIELFFLRRVVSIPFSSHHFTWCCAIVFGRLVGEFDCLIYFPDLILVAGLVVSLVDVLFLSWTGGVI
jgi:hypothetical protein